MKKRISLGVAVAIAVGVATALAVATEAQAAEPDATCSAPPFEGKRITIAVEGDGPDVVLIPGLSSPRAVWDQTAEKLKGRYRLHLMQVRGRSEAHTSELPSLMRTSYAAFSFKKKHHINSRQ